MKTYLHTPIMIVALLLVPMIALCQAADTRISELACEKTFYDQGSADLLSAKLYNHSDEGATLSQKFAYASILPITSPKWFITSKVKQQSVLHTVIQGIIILEKKF